MNTQELRECVEELKREAEEAIYAKNAALKAIIDRADNGTLGSSKVQDMRKIAVAALGDKA